MKGVNNEQDTERKANDGKLGSKLNGFRILAIFQFQSKTEKEIKQRADSFLNFLGKSLKTVGGEECKKNMQKKRNRGA
jgi:hypothetical protein